MLVLGNDIYSERHALAFQNLSGDPSQDYFADGVVEDIITSLSRLPWLFVTNRASGQKERCVRNLTGCRRHLSPQQPML
jgi:TolB-like protein